jgi:hypothetical protein
MYSRDEINKLTAEITRSTILTKNISGGLHYGNLKKGDFFCTPFSTASSSALKFYCVGGCWDYEA